MDAAMETLRVLEGRVATLERRQDVADEKDRSVHERFDRVDRELASLKSSIDEDKRIRNNQNLQIWLVGLGALLCPIIVALLLSGITAP
ncbi:MAG: hypothetical protein AAGG47_18205 [Pseudomonadota bacterium]